MRRQAQLNQSQRIIPTEEMARLCNAGFSLLPLGGGDDGKSPLLGLTNPACFPLKRVLGPMYGKGSACYGVRLVGLAVIDCDEDDQELVTQMEARFGASPVHVSTPRGVHLYYQHNGGPIPNLRGERLPVDIKRGASSYVVGPHSVRPDGGTYNPAKGLLGVDDLLPIITSPVRTNSGAIATGNRNWELSLAAIRMVEAVDDPNELFGNLAFIRDDQCEDPVTIPDSELHNIANWAWTKRLEGKVYRDRNSEFPINRQALDRLADFDDASDAIALLVVLQANHGHITGKTFALAHAAMVKSGHTSLSRERFLTARRTLQDAGLLGVAKEYSVGNSPRLYRLLRIHPELPKVQSLFASKEAS